MPAPIALQLYTVREPLTNNFADTIREVAELGYVGVETAGLPGITAEAAAAIFHDLGLAVSSAHTLLPLGEAQREVLDMVAALGCSHIVCPALPPASYASLEAIRRACDTLNEAYAVAAANGLQFSFHNHWWEFQPVEGRYPYQVMLENLDPGVLFEVDTYWVKTAGLDPIAIIKELGPRAPLLHIKDGPTLLDEPMVAVGDGLMDIPGVVAAGGDHTQWLIVELDRSDNVMMEEVAKSYHYLTSKGLAHGKR